MALSDSLPSAPQQASSGHVVEFYDDDASLAAAVADDLVARAAGGAAVVVVATTEHRQDIETAMKAAGIDVARLRREGRYLSPGAEDLLARFMVEDQPDSQRFGAVVGGLMSQAGQGGRPVAVFGEMVAVLWHQGNVEAAIELESLWNGLADHYEFHLLCGYPISAMSGGSLADVRRVCRRHTAVATPTTYGSTAVAPASEASGCFEVSQLFLPVPLAARAVRAMVRAALVAWGEHDLVPDVELVASELVSNAVVHAESPLRVSIGRDGPSVRLSVDDADVQHPAPREAQSGAPNGRGLQLVRGLACRWGIESVADGKRVWAEWDRSEGRRQVGRTR